MGESIEMGEADGSGYARQTHPSELDGPLPRSVHLNSNNGWFSLILALLFLGAGGVVCGFRCFDAFRQMQAQATLRRDGREAIGRVNTTHRGRGPTFVSYTFTINGVSYLGDAQMPDYRLVLHQADQITIRYLPTDPNVNHPADWEQSGIMGLGLTMFALVPTVIGGIALGVMFGDWKLARLGTVAEGIVASCAPNRSQFRVEYEFDTESGIHTKGSCDCWDEYEAGDRIWILYLLNRPQRNHSYPLAFFAVSE